MRFRGKTTSETAGLWLGPSEVFQLIVSQMSFSDCLDGDQGKSAFTVPAIVIGRNRAYERPSLSARAGRSAAAFVDWVGPDEGHRLLNRG